MIASDQRQASPAQPSLRDVVEADLPALFAHQCDPEGARLAAFTPRDEAAFYRHWRQLLADPTLVKKAIVVGSETVGHLAVFGPPHAREVGYWVAREHWGRGIATRALRLLLAEVRERPLVATVAAHNGGSIRVLVRCGFVRDGVELDFGQQDGVAIRGLVYRLDAPPG